MTPSLSDGDGYKQAGLIVSPFLEVLGTATVFTKVSA